MCVCFVMRHFILVTQHVTLVTHRLMELKQTDPVAECTAIKSIIRIVFVVEWALLTLGFVFITQFGVGMLASYVLSFHFPLFLFCVRRTECLYNIPQLDSEMRYFFSHACFSVLQ